MAVRYVLISQERADKMGLLPYRRRTGDGRVIINEMDIYTAGEAGQSFEQKVTASGGEIITAQDAKKLISK